MDDLGHTQSHNRGTRSCENAGVIDSRRQRNGAESLQLHMKAGIYKINTVAVIYYDIVNNTIMRRNFIKNVVFANNFNSAQGLHSFFIKSLFEIVLNDICKFQPQSYITLS